jgi:hypothetical protein
MAFVLAGALEVHSRAHSLGVREDRSWGGRDASIAVVHRAPHSSPGTTQYCEVEHSRLAVVLRGA